MNNKVSPIVITSRLADEHYSNIQNQYGDIVQGINNQAQKVAQYEQTRAQDLMNQKTIEAEAMKAQQEDAHRAEELRIKKLALATSY